MRYAREAHTLAVVGETPPLSLADWIVLTLVDESPMHGFAVAALTAERGDVGRAWHVPRPIVYRSLDRLTALDLARVASTEAGSRGPQRSVLASTPAGRSQVHGWLHRPVAHVRDVRSELLVKLALLLRRGLPVGDLIDAQRRALEPVQAALERQQRTESGFGQVLASWRVENVRAAMRFLEEIDQPRELAG